MVDIDANPWREDHKAIDSTKEIRLKNTNQIFSRVLSGIELSIFACDVIRWDDQITAYQMYSGL